MATPVIEGDVVEIKVHTQLGDQLGLNVLHYQCGVGEAESAGTLEQLAAKFLAENAAAYQSIIASTAGLLGITVQRIWPGEISAVLPLSTGGSTGALEGEPLPRQTCGLITKLTALGGRRNRGRVYVMFPTEEYNDEDAVPTSAYITLLGTLADKLKTILSFGTPPNVSIVGPVIWHREEQTCTPITNMFARSGWATQRRRGSFGSTNTFIF